MLVIQHLARMVETHGRTSIQPTQSWSLLGVSWPFSNSQLKSPHRATLRKGMAGFTERARNKRREVPTAPQISLHSFLILPVSPFLQETPWLSPYQYLSGITSLEFNPSRPLFAMAVFVEAVESSVHNNLLKMVCCWAMAPCPLLCHFRSLRPQHCYQGLYQLESWRVQSHINTNCLTVYPACLRELKISLNCVTLLI